MLARAEDLQDPLALDLFLEPPQGALERLVFSHQNFRHKRAYYTPSFTEINRRPVGAQSQRASGPASSAGYRFVSWQSNLSSISCVYRLSAVPFPEASGLL